MLSFKASLLKVKDGLILQGVEFKDRWVVRNTLFLSLVTHKFLRNHADGSQNAVRHRIT
jgi:hypothetical protein